MRFNPFAFHRAVQVFVEAIFAMWLTKFGVVNGVFWGTYIRDNVL